VKGSFASQACAASRLSKSMASRLPIMVTPASSISGPAKAMRSATSARYALCSGRTRLRSSKAFGLSMSRKA